MSENEEFEGYEKTEPRRDIHIDALKYDMYTELQESEDSPFYETSNHDLFMFTVGFGREKSMPQSIENDEHAFFGRSRLSDVQQTVLEAIAVEETNSVHVLRDQRRVYNIGEKYANAGIVELHGRVFGPKDDPLSELTLEIKGLCDERLP